MFYLANDVMSRIGLQETLIILSGIGLCLVHLFRMRSKLPASRPMRLTTWIPLLLALLAIQSNFSLTRRTYSLLRQREAINAAQREVLFEELNRGSVRLLAVGCCCTIAVWLIARRRSQFAAQGTVR